MTIRRWIMVDVETDGPCPGLHSMVSFGAVVVDPERTLEQTFYGRLKPISNEWIPEALAISGHTREETMAFPEPAEVMPAFDAWLSEQCDRPAFISDNNGFDWQFVNYYLWRFVGKNPFGHSSTNLGSLYKGLVKSGYENFKHLRRTVHDHHPVNDARGNAEALLHMIDELGLAWGL